MRKGCWISFAIVLEFIVYDIFLGICSAMLLLSHTASKQHCLVKFFRRVSSFLFEFEASSDLFKENTEKHYLLYKWNCYTENYIRGTRHGSTHLFNFSISEADESLGILGHPGLYFYSSKDYFFKYRKGVVELKFLRFLLQNLFNNKIIETLASEYFFIV